MTKCQFVSVLVVTATDFELSGCQFGPNVRHIVTGVGTAAAGAGTAFALAAGNYDLVVNAGIAGAVDDSLVVGEVVVVTSDHFADLGAYRNGVFVPFDDTLYVGLPADGLKNVAGATVSVACTPLAERGRAQIESMEGAAVMLSASLAGVPVLQLRAVSNYLHTPRSEWQISTAIQALNIALTELL